MSGPLAIRRAARAAAEVTIPLADVLRYMGAKNAQADAALTALAEEGRALFQNAARYAACFVKLPVAIEGDTLDFGALTLGSKALARNLYGCGEAILFAATAGMEAERQRQRAAVTSPALALALDAAGTAGIEAFCDMLCEEWAKENEPLLMCPRFSPGYGDLPLDAQAPLLNLLDARKLIGITLTETLMMIPQKSVSAIVGIGKAACAKIENGCAGCNQPDCVFCAHRR